MRPYRPRPGTGDRGTAGTVVAVLLLLVVVGGLPLALWLDLRDMADRELGAQAREAGGIIDQVRDYYAHNIVGRVQAGPSPTRVVHDYAEVPGAIPIPATLSLELGQLIGARQGDVRYRFFSDYPFAGRAPHTFDGFERAALATLRRDPAARVEEVSGSLVDRRFRLVTPVMMQPECVACHNTHPDSPKRDWKVGDVRGLQEVEVRLPLATDVFAFRHLLAYVGCTLTLGLATIGLQRRQAAVIRRVNGELERANGFLAEVSGKLARYLPPQLFDAIFKGAKDVTVATERKKLTVFFADIAEFTEAAERLQPEELTALLNEYLTEMSRIAVAHGATVDKFVGDAIVGFFGDPETRGAAEDAKACLEMALAMRARAAELAVGWARRGIERPFRIRIGINTGFCNVGNFGSEDRLAYTIVGAAVNLAARLQALAEPGGIVLGRETWALVRDLVCTRPLPAVVVKGIAAPVVPYAVEGLVGDAGPLSVVIDEHVAGLDLFVDTGAVPDGAAERAARRLREAAAALEARREARAAPNTR